jgi:hypothetical protein
LTRYDILDEWPDDFAKPHPGTLAKWLQCAVAAGLVQIEGTGRKADPYRYWVASAETRWRQHFLYEILEQQHRQLKLPFMSLRERRRLLNENADFSRDLDRELERDEKPSPPETKEE